MAVTINSNSRSNGMPSAPFRAQTINVTMDNSYPTGGEDVSATLQGGTAIACPFVPDYNGATLRWFRVENVGGVARLKAYADSNGNPGAEVANATDLSAHTFDIVVFTE